MKNMKLLIMLWVLTIFISGCGSKKSDTNTKKETESSANTKAKIEVKLGNYTSGDMVVANNEKGFYYVKKREDGSSNIKYINYENASEIYLCNRVECPHDDDTCNSWRPYTSGQHEIYLDKAQLYIIHTGANETQMSKDPQNAQGYISTMDLSGANEKIIHIFKNLGGSTYMSSAVFSFESIYMITPKTEKIENAPKTFFYLTKIDKKGDNSKEIIKLDLNNPSVIGIEDNKFIILDIDTSSDKGPAFTVYSLDIETKNINKLYSWDNKICFGRLHKGELYLFNRTTSVVSHLDLAQAKKRH